MNHRLYVSVHIPKTAGTSFQLFLKQVFGEGLILDYRSKPLDSDYEQRAVANLAEDNETYRHILQLLEQRDVCVHGHFLPAKYLALFPDATLITWLREPAQRLMSHYEFWRQNPQLDHKIARHVVESKLSFSEFCELDLMQNISMKFFGDLKASRFNFIGLTERYTESLEALCRQFNWPDMLSADSKKIRQNPLKTGPRYLLENNESKTVSNLNALDYQLYQEVLENHNKP
ncbi:MAG: sulfotransferase family 2 domain-containing protein [Halioglobus sp.]